MVPTRPDGMVHHKHADSLMGLAWPMNQPRLIHRVTGHEVGHAYTAFIKAVLADPTLSKWPYLLTIEDDNIVPQDAVHRLLESIDAGPFAAVSGIYFTKGDLNMPMAYGDPSRFAALGDLEFAPRDIRQALANGHVMEVNGIGMGCALWRMELFRKYDPPWFVTVDDGINGATQDLFFCAKLRRGGERIAVDMRVRVGHVDVGTGTVY